MIKPIPTDNCQQIHGLIKKKLVGNIEQKLLMDNSAIEFWESKIKQNQFLKNRSQNYTLRFVREGKKGFFALFVHTLSRNTLFSLFYVAFLDSLMPSGLQDSCQNGQNSSVLYITYFLFPFWFKDFFFLPIFGSSFGLKVKGQ